MPTHIVIGIDGGGTHTRAAAADLSGRVLSRVTCGGASPQHNAPDSARENVRGAILGVLDEAGCRIEDVRSVVAGIAGLDERADETWAEEFTRVAGLGCLRVQVNDSVVAHQGALLGEPGIVVISGTGSIILAINEAGERIRNYDLHHYAPSAARHIAWNALFDILAGNLAREDGDLLANTLQFWKVADREGLRDLARRGFDVHGHDATEVFGRFAPIVTDHALRGSPIARRACDRAADAICMGVRLLGAYFARDPVSVCLIGGSATSSYVAAAVATKLAAAPGRTYRMAESALPPELGAVLMALGHAGVAVDERTCARLLETYRLTPRHDAT